ncbi:unnamed protein product [Hydatigera taeniaeformis]|uniref:Rhomboid domain-containing protein n=1 Tax=Hydatigena taeniaeformis TaxID=6205 RepID=A0A0R3WSQ1_HYDTA|nr:unnamed protein product [Hydatigera taeniaeformis]
MFAAWSFVYSIWHIAINAALYDDGLLLGRFASLSPHAVVPLFRGSVKGTCSFVGGASSVSTARCGQGMCPVSTVNDLRRHLVMDAISGRAIEEEKEEAEEGAANECTLASIAV